MHNRMTNQFDLLAERSEALLPELPPLHPELAELYRADLPSGTWVPENDSVIAQSDWPVSIYMPERYEHLYAYPLVIWFHDDGSSEAELDMVLPAISDQNFCGLAFRGNKTAGTDTFCWDVNSMQYDSVPMDELLHVTTCRMKRGCHVHSERIFVAGQGTGADVALNLLLQRPEWLAGAALISPTFKAQRFSGTRLAELRGRQILMSASRTDSARTQQAAAESVRMMRAAGLSVDLQLSDQPVDPLVDNMSFVNDWLMNSLNAQVVTA